MGSSADISGFGWLLVGLVLAGSGVQHLLTRQILGRVHVGGPPLMEGWSVLLIGLGEIALGLFLILRFWRNPGR